MKLVRNYTGDNIPIYDVCNIDNGVFSIIDMEDRRVFPFDLP